MKKLLFVLGSVITFLLLYYAAVILISSAYIAYYLSQGYAMSTAQVFDIIIIRHSYHIVILSFLLLITFYLLFYKIKKRKVSELIQASPVAPKAIMLSAFIGFSFYLVLRYCLGYFTGNGHLFYIDMSQIYTSKVLNKDLLVYLLFAFVLLPLLEEVAHRGILFGVLRSRLSLGLSLFVQAVAYALVYTEDYAMIYIFVLGLLAGLAYSWYKSILLPIVMHLGFNGAALITNAMSISKIYDSYDTEIFILNAILLTIWLFILYRSSLRGKRKNLVLVK